VLGFLGAGIAGRDVGADDVDWPARGEQGDRGDPGGQVADSATEVVCACCELAGDHDAVVTVLGLGVDDVVASGGEGIGK
jgi:hypothetical protein